MNLDIKSIHNVIICAYIIWVNWFHHRRMYGINWWHNDNFNFVWFTITWTVHHEPMNLACPCNIVYVTTLLSHLILTRKLWQNGRLVQWGLCDIAYVYGGKFKTSWSIGHWKTSLRLKIIHSWILFTGSWKSKWYKFQNFQANSIDKFVWASAVRGLEKPACPHWFASSGELETSQIEPIFWSSW